MFLCVCVCACESGLVLMNHGVFDYDLNTEAYFKYHENRKLSQK